MLELINSQFILSWRLSNTLLADFCVDALQEALIKWGKPEIFNRAGGPDLYLRAYADGRELHEGLSNYFRFYNQDRERQSVGYQTPAVWYTKGVERGKVLFCS